MNSKTKTVGEIIKELQEYPEDAECYAYEGEVIGLIITVDKNQYVVECREVYEPKHSNNSC